MLAFSLEYRKLSIYNKIKSDGLAEYSLDTSQIWYSNSL